MFLAAGRGRRKRLNSIAVVQDKLKFMKLGRTCVHAAACDKRLAYFATAQRRVPATIRALAEPVAHTHTMAHYLRVPLASCQCSFWNRKQTWQQVKADAPLHLVLAASM
jgi:hypothetical protein